MNPKHHNPKQEHRRAHAPYNFVPLPEEVVTVNNDSIRDQDEYADNNGYIECSLTTMSPLYTRCAMTPDFFREHGDTPFHDLTPDQQVERAQFFHLKDEKCPLISGSSLRGMIRALVEIVGYGKVQWVTDNAKITYRAVAVRDDPLSEPYVKALGRYGRNVKAGYLVNKGDDWYICPAKKPSDLSLHGHDAFLKIKERIIPANAIPNFVGLNDKNYKPQYHEVSFDAQTQSGKRGKSNIVTAIGSVDAGHTYRGFLVCSGNMLETCSSSPSPRKKHALVLEQNPDANELKISEKSITNYKDGLTPFQKESPFDEQMGCLVSGRPIFYVPTGGEVLYFGHSPNFRIPAIIPEDKRIASHMDFVPKDLRSENDIDLAEAIFGYIDAEMFLFSWGSVSENDGDILLRVLKDKFNVDWAENADISKSDDSKTIRIHKDKNSAEIVIDETKEKATLKLSSGRSHNLKIKPVNGRLNIYYKEARAGRVFFTDAKLESARDDIWLKENPITPKILASPKPTTFQHYLVQDTTKGHNPDDKKHLAHYATPSPGETVIRGHKMYWHHKDEVGLPEIEACDQNNTDKSSTQFTCIKPVKTGATFVFRIYFENLQDHELGALLWVLTLPGESGTNYYHKLGMGKPLGMGAVKIEPKLYISNRFNRYNRLFDGSRWAESVSEDEDLYHFIDGFEKYVLGEIPKERMAAERLNEVERIKILLKMMEWPGPDTNLTEYLTIEPTNDYKERQVLPDPLDIAPS